MAAGQQGRIGRVAPTTPTEWLRSWFTGNNDEVEQVVQAPIEGLVEDQNDTVSSGIEAQILPANTGGFRRWIKNVGNVRAHIKWGATATTAHYPLDPGEFFDCSFTTMEIRAIPASGTMLIARLEFEAAP